MHGDRKESDGLCGLTRQSLSGQLNIWMHVLLEQQLGVFLVDFFFFFGSNTLKSYFWTFVCVYPGLFFSQHEWKYLQVSFLTNSNWQSPLDSSFIGSCHSIKLIMQFLYCITHYVVCHAMEPSCLPLGPWCTLTSCLPTLSYMVK